MSLTINHQLNDIINATGTITINGVAAGGDNTPIAWYGSRGLFGGGRLASGLSNVIDYITIASTGNATDFGDLSAARKNNIGAMSNGSRGVFGGGNESGGDVNTIEYVTISTTGNTTDFGDLTAARDKISGSGDGSRGLFAGGNDSTTIDYITIASTGNATDFGDLISGGVSPTNSLASNNDATRAVFSGGYNAGIQPQNVIQYVTVQTTGNATDFGDLTSARTTCAGAGSETRGLIAGGWDAAFSNPINNIEYITIQSTGNSTDFGDLTAATAGIMGTSNITRAVFGGGYVSSRTNVISYVTIANTGNSTDFGDLTASRNDGGACSGT
mgnify:CR=1 FL=1